MIASIFGVLLAFTITVQTPPPFPTPTQFPTFTPVSSDIEEEGIDNVFEGLQAIDNYLATAEAELENAPAIQVPPGIEQVANLFGFLRWLSYQDRALLGPFAPLFSFLVLFTSISLFLLSLQFAFTVASTIYVIAIGLWKRISEAMPG